MLVTDSTCYVANTARTTSECDIWDRKNTRKYLLGMTVGEQRTLLRLSL
jgi:hypothetical protein